MRHFDISLSFCGVNAGPGQADEQRPLVPDPVVSMVSVDQSRAAKCWWSRSDEADVQPRLPLLVSNVFKRFKLWD